MTDVSNSVVQGRYQLIRRVGNGRMSHVYLAEDLRNPDLQVAVKLLDSNHADDIRRELFNRETQALERLSHPNIVRVFDHGIWTDRGVFFLVLEWLEDSLDNKLKELNGQPIPSQDAYQLLHSIADALVLAHGQGVIHRDIKPANVLIDTNGTPKLGDFGISRLRDQLSVGLTLSNFMSGGYASWEQRQGAPGDERSDLYALGSVALQVLSGVAPTASGFQPSDANVLAIDPNLKKFISALLNSDPENRPSSALDARAVFGQSASLAQPIPQVLMLLTPNVISQTQELGLINQENHQNTAEWIIEEFGGDEISPVSCTLDSRGNLRLIGSRTRLHCTRSNEGTHLIVQNVDQIYGPDLEAARSSGFLARYMWQPISGPELRRAANRDKRESLEAIAALFSSLTTHNARRAVQHGKRANRRSLRDVWSRMLDLQRKAIEDRRKVLHFASLKTQADMLIIRLATPIPDDFGWTEGTPMAFFFDAERRERRAGQLIEASGDRLLIALDQHDTRSGDQGEPYPTSGSIGISLRESLETHKRQREALLRLLDGEAVNSKLLEILSDVRRAEFDHTPPAIEFIQSGLGDDKREAVSRALATRDLFLIQGPPGTGKTTVITEIILQLIHDNPSVRILLSSQSNVPVNHVLSRISSVSQGKIPEIVRLGRADKLQQGAEQWRLEERIAQWRMDVVQHCSRVESTLRSESRRLQKQIKRQRTEGLDEDSLVMCQQWLDEAVESLLQLEEDRLQFESLAGEQSEVRSVHTRVTLDGDLSAIAAEIEARTNDIDEHLRSIRDLLPQQFHFDSSGDLRTDVERLSSAVASASSNGDATSKSASVLKLLQDWRTVFGRTDEFAKPILTRANVLAATCLFAGGRHLRDQTYDWAIIDEAGRATPTELLVPLVRAKRAILVGDERQLPPMLDVGAGIEPTQDGISNADLERSLFEDLVREAASNAPDAIRMLRVQHRMHPAIGSMVSNVFYEGDLINGIDGSERNHGLPWIRFPVLWLSTHRTPNHIETQVGTSFSNLAELEVIAQLLECMEETYQSHNQTREVGVIAGYSGQVNALQERIFPDDEKRWRALDIEIATVDAFQGRDRDIIVYSTVRSNPDGRLGFLSDRRRLNVAVSRARQLLVIVGDAEMMRRASTSQNDNPFADILNYIDLHPGTCHRSDWTSICGARTAE